MSSSLKCLILVIVQVLSLSVWADTYTSHIVDAWTGEALPYVSVFAMKQSSGTMTNAEGAFSMETAEDDTLRITYAGYESQKIAVKDLPGEIPLKCLTKTLQEVTVKGESDLLPRVIGILENSLKQYKNDQSVYFMRQTNYVDGETQMVEAFIRAHSAVCLWDIRFLAGRHFKPSADDGEDNNGLLWFSNLHNLLMLGPMVNRNSIWTGLLTTPFNPIPKAIRGYAYRKRYETETVRMAASDGRETIKITFRGRESTDKDLLLCGSLFVDAATLSPLAFDGHLENFTMKVWSGIFQRTRPTQANIHITFSTSDVSCRVSDVAVTLRCQDIHCHTILFAVDKDSPNLRNAGYEHENMLIAIERSERNDALWHHEVVKRTYEEEQLANGQTTLIDSRLDDRWKKTVEARNEAAWKYPQEKVYLHLDNQSYFLGDTIRFKAYTRQTDTGRPSHISNVLYVDLLNHDGYTMGRRVIQLRDGEGHGDFVLRTDSTMYSGFYEIRAYTQWQLNWGRHAVKHLRLQDYWFYDKRMADDFFVDYDKIYSRVVPVYDRQMEKDDQYRDMTLRRTMRYTGTTENSSRPLIKFYPEGGSLVEEVPCQVAFEATTEDGEYLSGTLLVDGQAYPTINRGRGIFRVTVSKGEKKKVIFQSSHGVKTVVALPSPSAEGAVLHLRQEADSISIDVAKHGKTMPDTLALGIMNEGNLLSLHMLTGFRNHLHISKDNLRCGINQIMLLDPNGQIFADRLFFHYVDSLRYPSITVEGDKGEYSPLKKINLTVSAAKGTKSETTCSIAVREAASLGESYDNGNILTEMLLSSEIKGFVPHPGWFFEKDDEEHRQALDLLMMTQGWRRFEWNIQPPILPAEKYPTLRGQVLQYRGYHKENIIDYVAEKEAAEKAFEEPKAEEPEDVMSGTTKGRPSGHNNQEKKEDPEKEKSTREFITDILANDFNLQTGNEQEFRGRGLRKSSDSILVHGEFVQRRNAVVRDAQTRSGRFSLALPNYRDMYHMHLSASDPTKWDKHKPHVWISPNEDEYPEFYVKLDVPIIYSVKPFDFYQTHLPKTTAPQGTDMTLNLDGTTMRQVSVYNRTGGLIKRQSVPPALKLDAYDAFNAVTDAGLLDGWMTGQTGFARAIAHRYVNDMGIDADYDVTILPKHTSWNKDDSQYEGFITEFNASQYSAIQEGQDLNCLSRLDSVFIYTDYAPRRKGDASYRQSNKPEVIVFLKQKEESAKRPTFRDRFLLIQGYSIASDFYHPNYSRHSLPEGQKDYRRTLYWNSDLQLDENGEAHISFYNNSRTTSLSVEVDGQAADGTLLWYR